MKPPFPAGTIENFFPKTPYFFLSNFYPSVRDHPVEAKAIKDRWAEEHRLQRKANWAISNALRDGKIIKPDYCQKCGKKGNGSEIEAHHPDYSKPLEVEWLCTGCHGETRHKS